MSGERNHAPIGDDRSWPVGHEPVTFEFCHLPRRGVQRSSQCNTESDRVSL